MGIPIGLLTGVAGFIQPTAALMRRALPWSLPIIVGFAFVIGVRGSIYGIAHTRTIDLASYSGWFIPDGVVDMRRYLCAGYMHNASYLGGGLAIPAAWTFHVSFRARQRGRMLGPVNGVPA